MTAAAVSDAAGAAAASVHAHPVYDSAYNGHNHRTGDSPAAAEDEEEGAADVKGLAHPKLPNVEVRYDFSVNVPVPPVRGAPMRLSGRLQGRLWWGSAARTRPLAFPLPTPRGARPGAAP